MIWLEMISIRTAGPREAQRVFDICREWLRSISAGGLSKILVYRSARYATDVSIHLQWKTDPGPESSFGFEVISALRDLGLINHTLWVEQEEFITGKTPWSEAT